MNKPIQTGTRHHWMAPIHASRLVFFEDLEAEAPRMPDNTSQPKRMNLPGLLKIPIRDVQTRITPVTRMPVSAPIPTSCQSARFASAAPGCLSGGWAIGVWPRVFACNTNGGEITFEVSGNDNDGSSKVSGLPLRSVVSMGSFSGKLSTLEFC